jgi:polyribonucleotide nucleotidyltransferase
MADSDSDDDADSGSNNKKNAANPSRKLTATEKIRKKMAVAAQRQASGEIDASDDGWSTASSKKKSRNSSGTGGSKQGHKNSASSSSSDAAGATSSVEMKCMVESRKLGNIIGPKGATMHAIQDATGAKIDTPRRTGSADSAKPARSAPGSTTTVTITGTREACQKAKKAIKELCSKGYSTLLNAGSDFAEAAMSIPSGAIPEIFGAGGLVIRKIQDTCEVRIHVPEQREGSDRSETRRITIAGPRAGAARARQVIDSIVRFHHHPSTHPGIVHVKIPMTTPSDVGTIIGRGGSQIKHIQGTTKTRVYTPKNAAFDALEVMVVGPQKGVDVAQRMILKILEENAEIVKSMANGAASDGADAAGAGGAVDPDDPWGEADEEEEDLWAMAPKPSSTMTIDIPAK